MYNYDNIIHASIQVFILACLLVFIFIAVILITYYCLGTMDQLHAALSMTMNPV
jgi:hypothetical protein